MNLELHGFEETLRRIIREEVRAALAERDEWLSHDEAAEYLGVTAGHLYNLNGEVPSHKVGGRRRYKKSELDWYLTGSGGKMRAVKMPRQRRSAPGPDTGGKSRVSE